MTPDPDSATDTTPLKPSHVTEPSTRSPELTKKIILTLIVTLLAAASFYTLTTTTSSYVEAAKATHQLGGQLTNLEIAEENTIYLTFHFNNTSSLDIVIQRIAVNVYANGKFLGNFDRRERILLPPGEADITLTAVIHPVYMDSLTEEQAHAETILWFITGGAVVELPFEEMTVPISIQEYWVT